METHSQGRLWKEVPSASVKGSGLELLDNLWTGVKVEAKETVSDPFRMAFNVGSPILSGVFLKAVDNSRALLGPKASMAVNALKIAGLAVVAADLGYRGYRAAQTGEYGREVGQAAFSYGLGFGLGGLVYARADRMPGFKELIGVKPVSPLPERLSLQVNHPREVTVTSAPREGAFVEMSNRRVLHVPPQSPDRPFKLGLDMAPKLHAGQGVEYAGTHRIFKGPGESRYMEFPDRSTGRLLELETKETVFSRTFKNGRERQTFQNGDNLNIYPNGSLFLEAANGAVLRQGVNGDVTMSLPIMLGHRTFHARFDWDGAGAFRGLSNNGRLALEQPGAIPRPDLQELAGTGKILSAFWQGQRYQAGFPISNQPRPNLKEQYSFLRH